MIDSLFIGEVFLKKRTDEYFLMIDEDKILTVKNGKVVVKATNDFKGLKVVRDLAVNDLCIYWDITLEQLDDITARFLYSKRLLKVHPGTSRGNSRPSGNRQATQTVMSNLFESFRRVKFSNVG